MTEEEIRFEARLMAIERFICHNHNSILRVVKQKTGIDDAQINEIESQSLEQLRMLPVLGHSPEMSDVLGDETFHQLLRLMQYARVLRG